MLTKEEIEVWRRFLKSMDAMMSGQVDALCDMALATLTQSETAMYSPRAGYKLVPVEPTQAMRDAWKIGLRPSSPDQWREQYQAMLAFAPVPSAAPQVSPSSDQSPGRDSGGGPAGAAPSNDKTRDTPHPQEVINYLNECIESQSTPWPLTKVEISKTVADDIVALLSTITPSHVGEQSALVKRLRYIADTDDARFGEIDRTLREAADLIASLTASSSGEQSGETPRLDALLREIKPHEGDPLWKDTSRLIDFARTLEIEHRNMRRVLWTLTQSASGEQKP